MADADDRLATELDLLHSMYPEINYDEKRREVSYRAAGASFQLRLPYDYLDSALPDVLYASAGKTDLREQLKQCIAACDVGEEVLDSIVLSFIELVNSKASEDSSESQATGDGGRESDSKATIVVWLHHLLNTNKRKLALSPPSRDVSGVTKPGYPGVLVYSGPARPVHDHVNELKQQNWQAFQVRLESEEEWIFTHGAGVKEVEAMKDIVAEVGDAHKEIFLEAMRMR
ncbi:hypothetical protein LTR08_005776 [Meristemomyces frigidus]|nr:hypothetical protein LTR08_005776 [Meristemomyces frigidus]